VFPKLNLRRELLTDKPVVIELPALGPGEYEFKCGMNMVRGKLVVVARKP
jgi:plastocyanin domain-containing protein